MRSVKSGGPLCDRKRRSPGFPAATCELELIQRENGGRTAIEGRPLPQSEDPGGFQVRAQPSLNRVLIGELLRGEYIDKRESVILVAIRERARPICHRVGHGRLPAGQAGSLLAGHGADYATDGGREDTVDADEESTASWTS